MDKKIEYTNGELTIIWQPGENDVIEIQALLRQLDGWTNEDILLMPMGATPEELNLSIPKTLEHCIRNGWRFCDRLHISLFGNKQGV